MEPTTPEKKSNGALIGAVIVIALLVLGGVYVWQNNMKTLPENNPPVENTLPASAPTQENTEDSELNSLEESLNGLDVELEAQAIDSLE